MRFTLADVEAKEREIADALPCGYDGADRVWLRSEAIKQLGKAHAYLSDSIGRIPEPLRCSVCEKELVGINLAEVDQLGRCCMCQWRNARRVDCDCAYLEENESCTCDVAIKEAS